MENNGHTKCASRWDDQGTTVNVFYRPKSLFPPYTRWICPELSISRQKFQITGSRIRMEARFFSNLNGASLHSAFNFHLSIILLWLKYCWKGRKTATNSGERGGSVVECRTPEREVRGSRPTAAVLCPWARHFTPRKYWLITQEAMAPSRHDWKIVDWDVKPQHNQPTSN